VDGQRRHGSDVRAAVDFYPQKLGFSAGFVCGDPPSMAGVNLGEAQIGRSKALQEFENHKPLWPIIVVMELRPITRAEN